MRRGVIAVGIVVAAIAVIVLVGGKNSQIGRAAPALPKEVLVAPGVDLASLRGKPAIVNFWANYCAPCHREAPAYQRLSRQLAGRARLVGVNWNESRSSAESFLRQYHWTFPVLRDTDGTVGDDYRIHGLPTTFILDARGRIVATLTGPQSAADLRAALARVT